jgi:hypothetical protein
MSKARGLADLGNVYDDGALSNRNVIINGDFSVSQRADYSSSTSIASGAYSVDRWKANDPFNIQRFTGQVIDGTRTNYVKVSYNGTQSMGFMQLVEDRNYERLRGQTITISAYVRTNQALFGFRLYDGGQNYGPRFNADGNWHRATWTVTWSPTSPSYFQLLFDTYNNGSFPAIGSGDYMDIAMVQVEVGDTATPFEHPRSYGDELARCQRYYEVIGSAGTGDIVIGGYANNSTFYETFQFKTEKRAAPTVAKNGTWSTGGGAGQPQVYTASKILFRGGVSNVTGPGNAYTINTNSGSNFTADAEL